MKVQRLIGCLWLGLLLGAAVFCILWGRAPTKDTQAFLALDTMPPNATMPIVSIRFRATMPTSNAPCYTVPPSPSPTPRPTATPVPTATPDPEPFALVWYSDTQYYSYKKPEIFRSMTEWTAAHAEELNILAVVHTGDIVDNHNYDRHWNNARSALKLLNGYLPLFCVAGNHDVGAETPDYTAYKDAAFCTVTDRMRLYDGGVCWTQPFPERMLLLVGIGWQKDAPYLDWVKARIAEYPDYSVVLLVHSFLEDNGTLTENGKLLEKRLLADTPNIRLVLCGHKDGSVRWQKTYDDNTRTVNALLYNFQDDKTRGLGYLRVLTFDPLTRNIDVTTYSPFLNDYNYQTKESLDTFTLYSAF